MKRIDWMGWSCLVLFVVAIAGCSGSNKEQKPVAEMTPDEQSAELMAITCEKLAAIGAEEKWKSENPEKAKRWDELNAANKKYVDSLPAGEQEKYALNMAAKLDSCATNGNSPQGAAQAGNAAAGADAGNAGGSSATWVLDRKTNAMDGDIVTARRAYEFPDRKTVIDVSVFCKVASRETGFSFESFVGDPQSPSPESNFKYELVHKKSAFDLMANKAGSIDAVGLGRVKFNDAQVRSLQRNFGINKAAGNRMDFSGVGPLDFELIRVKQGMKVDTMQAGVVNWGGVVRHLFPFDIELHNGAGQFDVHVDASKEVLSALAECGGNAPIFAGEASQTDAGALEANGAAASEHAESAHSVAAAGSGEQFEASFDCAKASTRTEKLICSDADLARLDLQSASIFKDVLSRAGDPSALKQSQREWIRQERDACSDAQCITDAYRRRVKQLLTAQ